MKLSTFQQAALNTLNGKKWPMRGKALREYLNTLGPSLKKSGPAFYQNMAHLEEAGLVESWYEKEKIDGIEIKHRTHKLTDKGRAICGKDSAPRDR